MYTTLDQLPSGYIPYNEDIKREKIKIRSLTYGEVLTFSEYKDKFIDSFNFIKESNIIKGIDFGEITVGDWEFIELTLVAMSYADPIYTVNLGQCEACKETMSSLPEDELYVKIGKHVISRIPVLTKKVTHGEINFSEVTPDVTSSAEVPLENGSTAIVDFYRLKHHKIMLQEKKEESVERKIELLTGLSINDITLLDYTTLLEASKLMDHGLDSSFTIKCPTEACGFEKVFTFQWRLLQLRTYSFDDKFIRGRISFSKTRKPEQPTQSELQRGQSSLRPSG